jgi:hypothetical protein
MRCPGVALVLVLLGAATQDPVSSIAVVVQTRINGATNSAFCNFDMGARTGAGQALGHYVVLKDHRLLTQVLNSADGPTPADAPGPAWIADLTAQRTTQLNFRKQEYEMEWAAKDFDRAASLRERMEKRLTAFDRPLAGAPTERTKVLTMAWEYVEISDRVNDSDLTIPAGFKKK